MAGQIRTERDLRKIRRAAISGWIFVAIGIFLIGFGYSLYDSGFTYSGLFLTIMGIVAVVFGMVLVRYTRKIV